MRFVTVQELRSRSTGIWRRLAEEQDIVVTADGKPVAILSAVSAEHVEESLAALRRARAIAAVASVQEQSVAAGTHRTPAKKIQAEITAARKARRE